MTMMTTNFKCRDLPASHSLTQGIKMMTM